MADHTFKAIDVISSAPITDWWVDRSFVDDEDGKVDMFDPVVAIVTIKAKQASREPFTISLMVTAAELTQINYNVITNEGSFEISQFLHDVYHSSDFEVTGQKLSKGALSRSS